MRYLTRTTSASRLIAPMAVVALLAAGCGLGGGDQDADTISSAGAEEGGDADPAPTGTVAPIEDATDDADRDEAEEETAGGNAPPSSSGDPIATAAGTSPFIELEVYDLRRDGDTLTLEFGIRTDDSDDDHPIGGVFTSNSDTMDGLRQRGVSGWASHQRTDTVSGVTLVDRQNSNRHLVLRDSDEDCLCTRFADSHLVGDTVTRASAQFPAPPAGVTTMTVEVPTFPSIDNVPIREVS